MDTDRLLRNVRIAKPCTASWTRMSGDDRVRHCSDCHLNVYNFSNMTSSEIAQLLHNTEGRVCGRIYRRSDGTIITKDCPNGDVVKRVPTRITLVAIGVFVFSVVGAALTRMSGNPGEDPGPAGYSPLIEDARSWPIVGRIVEELFPQRQIIAGAIISR